MGPFSGRDRDRKREIEIEKREREIYQKEILLYIAKVFLLFILHSGVAVFHIHSHSGTRADRAAPISV